jgi:hypothetical protein
MSRRTILPLLALDPVQRARQAIDQLAARGLIDHGVAVVADTIGVRLDVGVCRHRVLPAGAVSSFGEE